MADNSLNSILTHYLTHFASGSPHTQRAKKNDILHFLGFLRIASLKSSIEKVLVTDWTTPRTHEFLDDCLSKGESPTTVARRLATLKHCGKTLQDTLPNFKNPAKEVKSPKIGLSKPKALDEVEIARLKDVIDKPQKSTTQSAFSTYTSLRSNTILGLLLDTGLRADEVRLLRLGQVDKDLEWLKNVKTKAKQFRNVYITSAFRAQLSAFLKEREVFLKKFYKTLTRAENEALPLFPSHYNAAPGEPDSFFMSPKSIWRTIRSFSDDKKLHPHLLRHSFASELLDHTKDIRLVSQALGHSDVRITMRYTERTGEEVAKALESTRKAKR